LTNEEILTEAYAAGQRRITCPSCNGGEEHEENTMSLWIGDDGNLRGKCFRATCSNPFIVCGPVVGWTKPEFEPRPLKAPYRRVLPEDAWGKEWIERTGEDPFFGNTRLANERGMRVLSCLPDVAVWRLRALDGTLTGHITRTLDKKISTYKDLDRALYYWNGVGIGCRTLFVFEDVMSAALCDRAALALLGTSIADGTVAEIKAWRPDGVLVCLDPGAEDAALRVYERLVANGVPAVFVPMAKDFKDMTVAERRELEETYA
jgi:hypothetical protein